MTAKRATLNEMLDTAPAETPEDIPAEEVTYTDEVETSAPRPVFTANKRFDASEVMTPRLVLAQGLSPEVRERKAQSGDWLLLGHEPEQSVTLVIAGHTEQRRFVEQGKQVARCWSPDAIQGYGNPGVKCEDCEFAKWTDTGRKDAQSGRTINLRPPCDELDTFVAFSLTHGMPVTWSLKGTGAKAARFLKTLSNGLGMGNFAVEVTAVSKSKDGRAWHEPVIKIANEVDKEQAQMYAALALGAVVTAEPQLAAEASA